MLRFSNSVVMINTNSKNVMCVTERALHGRASPLNPLFCDKKVNNP